MPKPVLAVAQLAAKYRGKPVDVLLHNAGWLGEREKQSFDNLDYATFEQVLRVNTFAPLETWLQEQNKGQDCGW